MRTLHLLVAALIVTESTIGCAAMCLSRQHTGAAANVEGEVGAGQIVHHVVPYDTAGSQNDVDVRWDDMASPTPPRLRFYITRTTCIVFQPPPNANSPECRALPGIAESAGWSERGITNYMIVSNGWGNPERLGSPAAYKVWVVGDTKRSTRYTIRSTYFRGPDC